MNDVRYRMEPLCDSVTSIPSYDAVSVRFDDLLDLVSDISESDAWFTYRDGVLHGLLGRSDQVC